MRESKFIVMSGASEISSFWQEYPCHVFVTLEGPEGAGKSTVARGLTKWLEESGQSVVLTREPGAGTVGQSIRAILLDGEALDRRCELFLFLADRSQHVASLIRPALAQGKIVLCDRFADSTVVYQGYGRGLELSELRRLNAFATGGLYPDLTILLDIDPEQGIKRIAHKDRLDSEPLDFHKKIRDGFLAEAKHDPDRWKVIDGSSSPEVVFETCRLAVESCFLNRRTRP